MWNFWFVRERTEQAEYKYRITCVLEVAENSIISVAHTAGNEANQISYHFYLSLISVEKQHLFPFTVYTKLRLWNRSIKTGTKARQRV